MRHAFLVVFTAGLASISLAQHHDDHKDNSRQSSSSHSSGGNSWNRGNGGSNQRGNSRFGSNQGSTQRQSYQRNSWSGGGYQSQRNQSYSSMRGQPDYTMRQQYNSQQSQPQRFNYSGGSYQGGRQQQNNNWVQQDNRNRTGGSGWSQQQQRATQGQRFNHTGGDAWGAQNRYQGDHRGSTSGQNRSTGDWRDGHHNLNGWTGSNPWRSGGTVHVYGADRFHHYDNWRFGYYQYNPYWNDSSFYFSFYSFTPYEPCVVSPWYVYPTLPPYIGYQHVYVLNGPTCDWYGGRPYAYNPGYGSNQGYGSDGGNPDLNYAIDQITQAFNSGNDSDLGRVIPSDSRVNIYNEGNYMYSVNGGDFYNMLMDNVHGTRTQRYGVTSVRMEGQDAIVSARHDYYNPYNGVSSAYQMFRLRPSGEGYVITDFMTSATPIGGSSVFGNSDW